MGKVKDAGSRKELRKAHKQAAKEKKQQRHARRAAHKARKLLPILDVNIVPVMMLKLPINRLLYFRPWWCTRERQDRIMRW